MSEVVKVPDGVGTESTIRSDSSKYNAGTLYKQLIHEEINSAMNFAPIVRAFEEGRARDIGAEPKVDKMPALIIGSGPSLDHSIKYMKDWKGGIFCSTSHALTLIRNGVIPTHIVALDPFSLWDEIKGIDWKKTNTKLVLQPGVWPTLMENWPNEVLLYRQNLGRPDSYYATTQKRMYSGRVEAGLGIREPEFHFYIPTEITLFACSPPIQMFIADILGYGNMFLAGVDFAFSKTIERFTGYTIKEEPLNTIYDPFYAMKHPEIWDEHASPFVKTDQTIYTNNGLPTHPIHLYYKKNMLSAWRLSCQTVYTTDNGAITEIPYASIEKVVRKQGKDFPLQSKKFVSTSAEKYLASVGAFVVETETGVSFVEAVNAAHDITCYMYDLNSQYFCDKCGINIKSTSDKTPSLPDLADHMGEQCPSCKEGKLKHSHVVDIPGQIKKFQHYLEQAGQTIKHDEWDYNIIAGVK